jgi:hypothetical protein
MPVLKQPFASHARVWISTRNCLFLGRFAGRSLAFPRRTALSTATICGQKTRLLQDNLPFTHSLWKTEARRRLQGMHTLTAIGATLVERLWAPRD